MQPIHTVYWSNLHCMYVVYSDQNMFLLCVHESHFRIPVKFVTFKGIALVLFGIIQRLM